MILFALKCVLATLSIILPFTPMWRTLMRNLGMWSRTQNDVDHGKLWSSLVLLALVGAHFLKNPFPITMAVMMGAMSFGRSVFTRFLEVKTLTLTRSETDIQSTTHTIAEKIERVVDEDGITVHPTPN